MRPTREETTKARGDQEAVSRKRVWIHIGSHKTGTSAIQSYLAAKVKPLERSGFQYMRAGRLDGVAHHPLAWRHSLKVNKRISDEEWTAVRNEIESASAHSIVISSEAFWFSDPYEVRREFDPLENVDVRVVAYIRRPDRYIEALYKQRAKLGRIKKSLHDFVASGADRLAFDQVLGAWGDAFGDANVIVRTYDDVAAKDGLIIDFCQVIGFAGGNDNQRHLRNLSPNRRIVELLHELGASGPDVDEVMVFERVMGAGPEFRGSDDMLTYPERIQIFEHCAPMLERVRSRFLAGRETLFEPPQPNVPTTESNSSKTLMCFRVAVQAWATSMNSEDVETSPACMLSPALNEVLDVIANEAAGVDRDKLFGAAQTILKRGPLVWRLTTTSRDLVSWFRRPERRLREFRQEVRNIRAGRAALAGHKLTQQERIEIRAVVKAAAAAIGSRPKQ